MGRNEEGMCARPVGGPYHCGMMCGSIDYYAGAVGGIAPSFWLCLMGVKRCSARTADRRCPRERGSARSADRRWVTRPASPQLVSMRFQLPRPTVPPGRLQRRWAIARLWVMGIHQREGRGARRQRRSSSPASSPQSWLLAWSSSSCWAIRCPSLDRLMTLEPRVSPRRAHPRRPHPKPRVQAPRRRRPPRPLTAQRLRASPMRLPPRRIAHGDRGRMTRRTCSMETPIRLGTRMASRRDARLPSRRHPSSGFPPSRLWEVLITARMTITKTAVRRT